MVVRWITAVLVDLAAEPHPYRNLATVLANADTLALLRARLQRSVRATSETARGPCHPSRRHGPSAKAETCGRQDAGQRF